MTNHTLQDLLDANPNRLSREDVIRLMVYGATGRFYSFVEIARAAHVETHRVHKILTSGAMIRGNEWESIVAGWKAVLKERLHLEAELERLNESLPFSRTRRRYEYRTLQGLRRGVAKAKKAAGEAMKTVGKPKEKSDA